MWTTPGGPCAWRHVRDRENGGRQPCTTASRGDTMNKGLAAVAALLIAGCGTTLPASAHAAPACSTGWGSLDKTAGSSTPTRPTQVSTVRGGQHACFDRLVLDLSGQPPHTSVGYVRQVLGDASGQRHCAAGRRSPARRPRRRGRVVCGRDPRFVAGEPGRRQRLAHVPPGRRRRSFRGTRHLRRRGPGAAAIPGVRPGQSRHRLPSHDRRRPSLVGALAGTSRPERASGRHDRLRLCFHVPRADRGAAADVLGLRAR